MNDNNIIDVTENIKNEIENNDIVLFMKGTPVFLHLLSTSRSQGI